MKKSSKEQKKSPGIILTKEQLKNCLGGVAEDTYVCTVECDGQYASYSSSAPCQIYVDYVPNGFSSNTELEVKTIVVNGQIKNGCAQVVPIIFYV